MLRSSTAAIVPALAFNSSRFEAMRLPTIATPARYPIKRAVMLTPDASPCTEGPTLTMVMRFDVGAMKAIPMPSSASAQHRPAIPCMPGTTVTSRQPIRPIAKPAESIDAGPSRSARRPVNGGSTSHQIP
ncbi:unannotated protein [freshwater metagenome]|uniref:Unannotated protein n=1 Tax=freshwater metagenome TaxID=449393 RepID=A0A6J6UDI1_9ZZZZ